MYMTTRCLRIPTSEPHMFNPATPRWTFVEGVVNLLTDLSLNTPIDSPHSVLRGLVKLGDVQSTMLVVERLGVVIADDEGQSSPTMKLKSL